jgi:tubulin polyglutamylase TTLL6/13
MSILARKNCLAKHLIKMKKKFPVEYDFFPPTWLLPLEANDFKA